MTFVTKLTERREKQDERNRERNATRKAANIANLLLPPRTLHRGIHGPAVTTPAPKGEPKRNRALLDMAEGRRCLLCLPGQCTCTPGSTVAAHSNFSEHAKSMGRKADDQFSVWAGDKAHEWLDRSAAPIEEKRVRFMLAHLRQVDEWRWVMQDETEPERFRKAARWALEQLDSSMIEGIDAARRAGL